MMPRCWRVRRYGFNMVSSLGSSAKVLSGLHVFVAPVPATAKVPPSAELKLIVESAGGKWLASATAAAKAAKGKARVLVVAVPEALAGDGALAATCAELAASVPAGRPVNPSCLFDAVMRKHLDTGPSYHVAGLAVAAGQAKRKR